MMLSRPLFILFAATSACTGSSNATGNDASPTPVEAPAPDPDPGPTRDPEPAPDPEPEPSEGKACGARAGDTCGDDEYCAYEPSGMCGWADATAVCEKKPQMCTREYDPVCGCDQKVYPNACSAAAAGTGVLQKGDCEDLPGAN